LGLSLRASFFIFLLVVYLLFPGIARAEEPYSVVSTELIVYRDGVVRANQVFNVNETEVSIVVTLLSSSVDNLLALDQANLPLSLELKLPHITIVTLGASRVIVEYLTSTLTSKKGDLWTLNVDLPYGANITLPDRSTVVYLSDLPTSITSQGNKTVLRVGKGTWEVSYVLPLIAPTAPSPTQKVATGLPFEYLLAGVASVALFGSLLFMRRRRSRSLLKELRDEDREILRFIAEKGGRVLESELRQRFILPKTSMWRLARRLERMGYIRIKKVGVQNEIEVVRGA